jgi:hypothetical protein
MPFLDVESVEDAFLLGRDKELLAAMEEYRPKIYNWNNLFSYKYLKLGNPIHPDVEIDVPLAEEIFSAFCRARYRLTTMRLYPSYSHKTIGREASRNLSLIQDLPEICELDIPRTTFGLEKLYHHTGCRITGPTEIRWAWTFNILKPRLYYARGPDQYYDSRYIQAIFNVLVDSLPVTHRFERFFTTSMHIDPDEVLMIYDYESFTSLLDEIRNFTAALADFLRGYEVEIIDTFQGIVITDLGDMMDQFNQACNQSPEFDSSGAIWDKTSRGEDPVLINHTCGMLGVPGNISSCTLLHGIHLIHVVRSLTCKVVGDDAAMKTRMGKEVTTSLLQGIGRINIEKVEAWENLDVSEDMGDHTWHYVKRPIDRVNTRVFCGVQAVWPSAAYVAHFTDKFHTVHYPESGHDFRKRVANMLCAFCRQFRDLPEPQVYEKIVINRFIRWALDVSGLVTRDGSGFKSYYRELVYPIAFEEAVDIDAWLMRIGSVKMTIPEFELIDPPGMIVKGVEYRGFMKRSLKLAVDLGYAVVSRVNRSFFPRDFPDLFKDWFLKLTPFTSVVDFVILEDCPIWIENLIISESHSYDSNDIDSDSDCSSDYDIGIEL